MSKDLSITISDEVYCTIEGLSAPDRAYVNDKLSAFVEGYRYMAPFKLGRWDGRQRFLDNSNRTPFRLLSHVLDEIDHWGYAVDLVDERKPVSIIEGRADKDWFIRKNASSLSLRPYQVEIINIAIETECGLIEAATGSGKTWMVAALCDILNASNIAALVVVPSSDLVEQTIETLRAGKLDVGVYSGDNKDYDHLTVVATWQALQYNPEIVKLFDALIIDEAHGASAKVVSDLANNFGSKIRYRWGFTGTIPKEPADRMALQATFGDVIYKITAAELMRMGYLAELEIEPIETQDTQEQFPDYASEKSYLSKTPERLDLLADIIITKADTFGNTLVLVNSIKQGQQLQKLIKNSVFLYGDDKVKIRRQWYELFENANDLIVIATFGIASTGISIDRIFALIMIDAGKAFERCIQSIGRGLRLGHDKTKVHCADVHSKLKWSMKHWRERKKYYDEAEYRVLKTVKIKA